MTEIPYHYLRDIRGLDPIGWWPPALGWWLAAVLVILILVGLIWLWNNRHRFGGGWRGDAIQSLKSLKYRSSLEDPKLIGDELSELLRRIAIAHRGRRACAGITGEAWLEWLSGDDPNGFDWKKHGQILLTLPYAPPKTEVRREELKRLIEAALRWVTAGVKEDTLRLEKSL